MKRLLLLTVVLVFFGLTTPGADATTRSCSHPTTAAYPPFNICDQPAPKPYPNPPEPEEPTQA